MRDTRIGAFACAMALFVIGCGDPGLSNDSPDFESSSDDGGVKTGADLSSVGGADLSSVGGADLSMVRVADLSVVSPTDGPTKGGADLTSSVGADASVAPAYKYVINKITLPMSGTDDAIDLNGDGKVDNAYGRILQALATQGVTMPQTTVDTAVSSGQSLYLVELDTADAQLMSDPDAQVTLYGAAATANPDFSGMGHFTIGAAVKPAQLDGALASGMFSSENPVTTHSPVSFDMGLPFFSFGAAQASLVGTPLNGLHVSFTAGQTSGSPTLSGQLQGSIKHSDFESTVIPSIAASLQQDVAANPGSSNTMTILQLFDTGMCTNPNGTLAVAGDGKIDTCEVGTNSIIANVFAADVQIYDANGNYAPNKLNTQKDSLSVGIAFTAVRAMF